ncbi:MAG: glycogen/starch synthase [Candidatus Aminicenantes bacterium]|nr:MAG: glycogen/starch synthase [Candidatus Aminicenantes bacterium]
MKEKANTNQWQKNWRLMESFFNEDEVRTIKERMQKLEARNVAFCSFESRFARRGGLAAVTKTILPALAEIKEIEKVLLMTPFYPYIMDESKLSPTGIKPFYVIFGGKLIKVELLKYTPGEEKIEEYYLKAPGFFEARNPINDPYGYFPGDPGRNQEAQRENALFFCKVVPFAMKALGIRENIVFHLQEWQTTLMTLTSKQAMLEGTLKSCGCVQTMHNSFDSWIPAEMLAKITDNKKIRENQVFMVEGGLTAYQLGLQLMDAPVTTVSEHFAGELTSDRLQTGHFADHLQEILKKSGVVGVNNGMFIKCPPEFSGKEEYKIVEVKEIKLAKRKALLKILDTYFPKERFGQLTYQYKSIRQLPDNVPILVMSGRLDPFQKGFDILLRAVEKFARDEIKVILTPMPIKNSDLEYFYKVAWKRNCRGNVTVFPIRMEKGYQELQMGSTFGIMPSIYEPFGAAVEYMVNGTVTISRKTGGLVNQIQHKKNGFLYRESPEFYTLDHIKAFARFNDAVQKRRRNQWVQSMADELFNAVKEAIDIYQNHADDYYRLIIEGLKQAGTFTWQKAAQAYFKVYEKVKDI